MITTLTMNPCVDHTAAVQRLELGETNRVTDSRRDAAGKGINVSVALRQMGLPTRALCVGHSDGVIRAALEERGIPYALAPAPGRVRTNLKLFDQERRVMTECNERGAPLPPETLEAVDQLLRQSLAETRVLALSGSVPPGVPDTFYRDAAAQARRAGVPVVLDASGALLRLGAEAGPWLIKPNRAELRDAFGIASEDRGELVRLCRELAIRLDIRYIALSMGEDGALLIGHEGAWFTRGAEITVRGVQGAGDSMVAGFCAGLLRGITDGGELLRLAVAAADASLEKPGTQMCTADEVDAMLPRVRAEAL